MKQIYRYLAVATFMRKLGIFVAKHSLNFSYC